MSVIYDMKKESLYTVLESAVCGGRVSMSETCNAPLGAINTIPAAQPRSVVTGRATGD